jgi:hypothetical protein
MKYNATKYVGKTIQLYPGDSVSKYGVIEDLDDLGWTVKITRVGKSSYHADDFEVGETYFISHSKNFTFRFIED